MADVTLSDGKEITFDLSKMTIKEYRSILDPQEETDKSDGTLARVAGMELEDVQNLPYPDYRRIANAFFKKCQEPLQLPN